MGSLTRTPYGEYPEYHTSATTRPRAAGAARGLAPPLPRGRSRSSRGTRVYCNLAPKCEPQLGQRGLYGAVGGQSHAAASADGDAVGAEPVRRAHSLLDVAERSRLAFPDVRQAALGLWRRPGSCQGERSAPDEAAA